MKSRLRLTSVLLAALLAASASHAADVVKLSTGALSADASWTGGLVPGSANTAVFDGTTTVTSGAGATFDASGSSTPLTWLGMKVTDIQGNLSFTNVATVTVGTGGVDMSAATANVSFNSGTLRFGGNSSLNIASGRTLTVANTGTSANSTITLTGGGTLVTSGSVTGANRFALDVTNGTLAGTGTYRPFNTNVGYGIRVGTGSFVSAGNGGVGTLTFDLGGTGTSTLVMSAGSAFKFDLGAASGSSFTTPGTADLVAVTNSSAGDVTFNNNTINFLGGGEVGFYKLFDGLADTEAADSWSGLTLSGQSITGGLVVTNLAGGLNGALFLGDGASFGDLGDIYLQVTSAVPEPSTYAAFAGLVTLGVATLRRRRA